jgi:hypothetical protein
MSPFAFLEVASFFIGGLFYKPLCVFWDCPFFHRRSFFDESKNKGSGSTPLFVALLICAKALVECQANLVSYFDLTLS